jgi:hypothetical protein
MTIAITDLSATEQLDREARMAVRGGIANISLPGYSPPSSAPPASSPPSSYGCWPQLPEFPSGFPFDGYSPIGNPEPQPQPLPTEPTHLALQ